MTDNSEEKVLDKKGALKERLFIEIGKGNYLGVIDALSPLIIHEEEKRKSLKNKMQSFLFKTKANKDESRAKNEKEIKEKIFGFLYVLEKGEKDRIGIFEEALNELKENINAYINSFRDDQIPRIEIKQVAAVNLETIRQVRNRLKSQQEISM